MASGKVKIIHGNGITGIVNDLQHGRDITFIDQGLIGKRINVGDNVSFQVINVPVTGELAVDLNLLNLQ